MKYKCFKLEFKTAVHLGNGSLSDSEYTIFADTLFSALCTEAVKCGGQELVSQFYNYVKSGELLISDCLPYLNDIFYIPKPCCNVDYPESVSFSDRKIYRNLNYIPANCLSDFMKGKCNVTKLQNILSLGKSEIRTNIHTIPGQPSMLYEVGTFRFNAGNGLYFIVGYENEEAYNLLFYLMDTLAYQGIGGRLSQGLGKFNFFEDEINDDIRKLLSQKTGKYMSLSICMAKKDELPTIINGSTYQLIKRSGFVASETYSEQLLKKNDFYSFSAGSCFQSKFSGDIFDVSAYGNHPVYRYAVPFFVEV